MVGDENIEPAELRGGGRYQFSRGLRRRKIALDGAAIFRPAFIHKDIGLLFR